MTFQISIYNYKEYVKGQCDCWTLVQDIYAENGIELPDYIDVRTANQRKNFKEFLVENMEYKEIDKPERGALILFETDPYHCGIAVDENKMIHRAENINTRIERIDGYGKKIAGIYLVKKVSS